MALPTFVQSFAVKVVKPRMPQDRWEHLRLALGQPAAAGPPSLTTLAKRHRTDKAGLHRYTEHYERFLSHLRDESFTFFEIGIGSNTRVRRAGASLKMWRDFFPHAQIVGLDIQDRLFLRGERITPYLGSQVDPEVLDRIFEDFDDIRVILDDGSHRPEHIRETFRLLFDRLPEDGIYIIEDTQTSYWPAWGGSLDRHDPTTTMALVKDLIDGLNHEEYLDDHEPSSTDLTIKAVHCFHNTVIIEKGDNREGTNKRHASKHDFGDTAQVAGPSAT